MTGDLERQADRLDAFTSLFRNLKGYVPSVPPKLESERRDFWEICEERYQTRSTILTSQVPVAQWHQQIGDATSLTASSAGSCTTLIASSCAASPCAKHESRKQKAKRKTKPDNPSVPRYRSLYCF